MTVFYLAEAQADLAALQDYMLARWNEALDEIYNHMDAVAQGKHHGVPVVQLLELGIEGYLMTLTSHHRIVYRRIAGDTYIYIIAGQRQDFLQVLERRLMQWL